MAPRALALSFLTGLLTPAIAVAAAVQTGGEPLAVPPLPVPPASAAHDPDAVCAAAMGGPLAGEWVLCRLPTGEEAAALSRRTRAHGFYRAILLRRYGGERMADLATEAAMETYRRLSDRAQERRIDACVERARSGR